MAKYPIVTRTGARNVELYHGCEDEDSYIDDEENWELEEDAYVWLGFVEGNHEEDAIHKASGIYEIPEDMLEVAK